MKKLITLIAFALLFIGCTTAPIPKPVEKPKTCYMPAGIYKLEYTYEKGGCFIDTRPLVKTFATTICPKENQLLCASFENIGKYKGCTFLGAYNLIHNPRYVVLIMCSGPKFRGKGGESRFYICSDTYKIKIKRIK